MALFKIFKGLRANLPTDKYVDGWCYVTTDDGKMYIDTKDNDSNGRIVLNAEKADKLTVNAGSTNQPVYFQNGIPTEISYTINKSVPSDAVFTDTHYLSSNIVNNTANTTANTTTALTNGNVYLNHIDGGAITSSHKISGSGATSVTTDTAGNIIISSAATVTQNVKNDNVNYPLLGADSSSPTSGTAATVVYDTGMHLNPSTNTITATNFAGTASKATADGLGNVITSTYETKTDAAAKLEEAKTYTDSAAEEVQTNLDDFIDEYTSAMQIINTQINDKANSSTKITAGNGLTGDGTLASDITLAVGAGTGIKVSANAVAANLRSTTALTNDSAAATETAGRVYPVAIDKSKYLAVNVPWTDTTYTAGTGISINNSNKINHSNSITAGSTINSAQTAAYGANFNIPVVNYDANGHITSVGTNTVKMPANVDIHVAQSVMDTTDDDFPVLLSAQNVTSKTDSQIQDTAKRTETLYYNPSTGLLTAKQLKITNTGTSQITFSRENYNYLKTPANGLVAICCADSTSATVSSLITSSTAVYPGTTDTITLGTSSKKWKNVYATTFTGNLTGNVTGNLTGNADTATKVNNALTINGKTYDGSSAINVGTIGAAYGGTGKTTLKDAANALLNALDTGNSAPADADYYISQYVNGGTTTTTYHRRPMSALWSYIKSKADGAYVNVGGDTMTGTLGLRYGVTKGTAPSTATGRYIQFLETGTGTAATNRTGMIYNYLNASNDCVLGLYAYKSEAGVSTNAALYVQYMGDGTKKVSVSNGTKIYGAVWNDYAEFRKYKDNNEIPYGHVVIENGDDSLSLSTERLQKGGNICSDTYGFAIGESDNAKMPIAVSGRALVYTNENRNSYKPGDAVCTGPNGTVSKMTREEIKEYPDCIIGYVSAIPDYEIWGEDKDIKVNGRIWIKVV